MTLDFSISSRSLPNWQNLKEESQEVSMSEEDLRAMNFKESSILTSNLSSSESLIPLSEIISDVVQLRTLGNLCESMVSTAFHLGQDFEALLTGVF